MKVLSNFEGAMVGPDEVRNNEIFLRVREEKTTCADGFCHDYGYHFSFGIENDSDEVAEARIYLNCRSADDVPDKPALIFKGDSPEKPMERFQGDARTDRSKKTFIRLPLKARETAYLANYYFRSYRQLSALFDDLGQRCGAERSVIGRTVGGKELVSYRLKPQGPASAGSILITSGFHPPESDTVATEEIFRKLADPEWRRVFAGHDLYLVPISNPDGFVMGHNAANGAQVNFQWKFDVSDPDAIPEAMALWALAERIKPILYFDFHGYTFQMDEKFASPYLKPTVFYQGRAVRRVVKIMNERIMSLTNNRFKGGLLTYAPSTFFQQLTERFNTITYAKFHIHIMDGLDKCRRLATDVLAAAVDTLRHEGFTSAEQILKKPHGRVTEGPWLTPVRGALRTFNFSIKPHLTGKS